MERIPQAHMIPDGLVFDFIHTKPFYMKNDISSMLLLAAFLFLWSCKKEDSAPSKQSTAPITNEITADNLPDYASLPSGLDTITAIAPAKLSMPDYGDGRTPCFVTEFHVGFDTVYSKEFTITLNRPGGDTIFAAYLVIDGVRTKTIFNIPDTATSINFFKVKPPLVDPALQNPYKPGNHTYAVRLWTHGPKDSTYSVTCVTMRFINKTYLQKFYACPTKGLPFNGWTMTYQ